MGLIRNVRSISRLSLVLLLLVAAVIGAFLSYLWVVGYYVSLKIRVPETATVTITNATFSTQNTTFFNVTLLNPSFSPSDANITQIAVSTKDGVFHAVTAVPSLPYKLPRSGSETFKCLWNWANYTGETIRIVVFLAEGSGASSQVETPFVGLAIRTYFNSTISVNHFNVTIENAMSSATYVNITGITVAMETVENVTPSLPYTLHPNASVTFMCMWNWTDYQGRNVDIAVHTLQGYEAYHTQATPSPIILTISDVLFNVTDTNHFNVTIQNSELSPTYVNITRIIITMEDGTPQEITEVNPPLTPPYTLHPNASATFMCSWNWTNYRDKSATIMVHTLQGYVMSYTQVTPAPIILTITELLFNTTDTTHFNVTIQNSKFSLAYVDITRIALTMENRTVREIEEAFPPLLYTLYPNSSVTFMCTWNWTDYRNKNVTVTIYTLQGYMTTLTQATTASSSASSLYSLGLSYEISLHQRVGHDSLLRLIMRVGDD